MRLVHAETRKRCGMNAKTRAFLAELKQLIEDERDFWPITVRRVFYAYIGRFALPSDPRLYTKTSDVLHRARITGEVPWEALEDRTRGTVGNGGWAGAEAYVEAHRRYVLNDYQRDLQLGQAQRLEVWIEKDALAHIAERAAAPYTIQVSIARGFSSGSFKSDGAERIRAAAEAGQRTHILYFGDLDPSGAYMPIDVLQALRDDMGVEDLAEVWHCGLLPEQVKEHRLPSSIDAMKEKDTRTPWFKRTYPGQHAVELDALPSGVFFDLVQESIETWLDRGAYEEQQRLGEEETGEIAELRERVTAAFAA